MKRLITILGLNKEAILFDSRLYIIKAALAVATGYIVGISMPIASLDMISVLLGVMYNLEPINILGIKGGISQLAASILGAVCTALLIILFGINAVVISISMALTLFVCLKINYRMVSPVAIFTCIYMTQFVQKNSVGDPSIWLTFRLRIIALGVGVLIAISYNYIFSFFYYKRIAFKRLQFAKLQLLSGLEYTQSHLKGNLKDNNRNYITIFPGIFNDIDLVYSNIELMMSEAGYTFKVLEKAKLLSIQKILQYFRDINHLAYDINFTLCKEPQKSIVYERAAEEIAASVSKLRDFNFSRNGLEREIAVTEIEEYTGSDDRVTNNVNMIRSFVLLSLEEAEKL